LALLGAELNEEDQSTEWTEVEVVDRSGEVLCTIERNEVQEGSLGEEEVSEFRDEIADCYPRSASDWIATYLGSVRTIYAFQIYGAVSEKTGWDAVRAAQAAIWNDVGGILQADLEGFSNEDGYHILWQFSSHVTGDWNMAVLEGDRWVTFKMDLGDPEQRQAFQRGEVPKGARSAS
jgi:hypothetical protein